VESGNWSTRSPIHPQDVVVKPLRVSKALPMGEELRHGFEWIDTT
jgi:hypothetical protein